MQLVARLLTEDYLIEAIRDALGTPSRRLRVGIGDDAGVWKPRRSLLSLITTDALIEGVHFRSEWTTPEALGHKALAQNLSDIAAMGGQPVLAVVALGITDGVDEAWTRAFYKGIAALANRSGCAIAGGDIVRAPSLTMSVSIVGEVRKSHLKLRSGARPGDFACVTGPLGLAAAALRLLQQNRIEKLSPPNASLLLNAFNSPEPRMREGAFLGSARAVHALMDISDGLSLDIGRVAKASGLDIEIDFASLHPHAAIAEAAKVLGASDEKIIWMLHGGDDYELLAAVDSRALEYVRSRFRARFRRPLEIIGRFQKGNGRAWLLKDEKREELPTLGYDHLRMRAR